MLDLKAHYADLIKDEISQQSPRRDEYQPHLGQRWRRGAEKAVAKRVFQLPQNSLVESLGQRRVRLC